MKKNISLIRLIPLALSLLFLLFSAGMCKKPDTCHRSVTFVNNSDSVVSVCDLWYFPNNGFALNKITEVAPNNTVEVPIGTRECLEEVLLSYSSTTIFTYWVLPETYTYVHTSEDSLDIVYNILKKIDLLELGSDSLLKTNYTIYYP